jgi:hypothetical protein
MSLALGSTQRTAIASATLAPVPSETRLTKRRAVSADGTAQREHRRGPSSRRRRARRHGWGESLASTHMLRPTAKVPSLDVMASLSCSMFPDLAVAVDKDGVADPQV